MNLASAGFSIINGLARGIYTLPHKEAISAGADIIAVFSCCFGTPIPPEHIKLKQQIVEQGAIVTEPKIL